MKIKSIIIASVSGIAVLLSSCVVEPGVYGSVTYTNTGYGATYSTTVAWTNASYDSNGFPIYGYAYGRPVYGYTEAGVAIYTIAALTALCFVPDWGPAPWYHGPHHYPPHIHRAPAPPKYTHGHKPHHRPSGGMNAPIHKNPSSVLGKPKHQPAPKPAVNHGRPNNNKPVQNAGRVNKPAQNIGNRVNNASKPAHNIGNRVNNASKPAQNIGNRVNNVSKPAQNVSRPAANNAASRVNSHASRASGAASRPSGAARKGRR